jgi:hypothetical protein
MYERTLIPVTIECISPADPKDEIDAMVRSMPIVLRKSHSEVKKNIVLRNSMSLLWKNSAKSPRTTDTATHTIGIAMDVSLISMHLPVPFTLASHPYSHVVLKVSVIVSVVEPVLI